MGRGEPPARLPELHSHHFPDKGIAWRSRSSSQGAGKGPAQHPRPQHMGCRMAACLHQGWLLSLLPVVLLSLRSPPAAPEPVTSQGRSLGPFSPPKDGPERSWHARCRQRAPHGSQNLQGWGGGVPGGCAGSVRGGRWSALLTHGTPWGAQSKGTSLLSAGRTWQTPGTPLGWQPGAPSPAQVTEGLPAHPKFLELRR